MLNQFLTQARAIMRDNESDPQTAMQRACAYLTREAQRPVYAKTEPRRSEQLADRQLAAETLAEIARDRTAAFAARRT